MNHSKFPNLRELEKAVVEVLKSQNGPLTNELITKRVVEMLRIPTELTELVHKNAQTELEYRLAWARTGARKRQLIVRIGPKTWKSMDSSD